jgi:hypothetical protein
MDRLVLGAIKRRWKKFKTKGIKHVPTDIPRIAVNDLRTGDIILFYYGNKLTELHGRYRKASLGKYDLVPFHAAMFFEHSARQAYLVDPEMRTTASLITEYTKKSSCRIEIIRYPITADEMEGLYQFAQAAIEEELTYDFRGYGSFLSDFNGMGWFDKLSKRVAWLRPSKKNFFCSDFDASAYESCVRSLKVSNRQANKTAPIDLLAYALKSPIAERLLLKDREA